MTRQKTILSYKAHHGFTIVELLIVIVIIGILASLVIITYNGVQQRAQAVAIVDGIQKFKRSLKTYATGAGYDKWPRETDFLGTNNPAINSIAADSRYSDYIKTVKNSYGVSTSLVWFYDSDGDTAPGSPSCSSTQPGQGVSIIIPGVSQAVATSVDQLQDDSDLGCGNIRYQSSGSLVFQLGLNETEF